MKDLLILLKTDLAVREDNFNCGSKLGGNAAELFYLLSKDSIELSESNQDNNKVSFIENNNILHIICNKKVELIHLRKGLSNFLINHSPMDFNSLLQNIRSNININLESEDINKLIECINLSDKLVFSLKNKEDSRKNIENEFEIKMKKMKVAFLASNPSFYLYAKLAGNVNLESNPHFNSLSNKLMGELELEIKSLLSEDDSEIMRLINNFPPYISLLCTRLIITLELVIKFYIDDYINNFNIV